MANSRHGKFVSVTDWFAPPPGSTEQNNVVKIGAPSGGASFSGGGSWGSGNNPGGGSSVTIIKTNDTTPESNSNVYSALRVKNNFIAKNKNERTSGKLSSDIGFEVGEFVSGTSGALLYVDPDTLETTAELDRLYVRVKAYFEELEIVNVNSIGGKQLITPAGSVKCYGVATYDEDTTIPEGVYRCYFLAEQDGVKIKNRFEINDQIYCQEFNASTGSSQQVSSRFYWRLCTGVSTETVSYNDKQCHYIDLSMSDAATDSDAPKADDILCHRGNRTDSSRQGVLEFSAVDTFSPSITLYQEVGKSDSNAGYYPYNLTNRDVVSYGVNQTTGAAFMNVYGNMYIGNRDESSFLSFDTKKGLSLKGSLRMGSTLEGKDGNELTLEERFEQVTQAYKEDINQFKAAIDKALGGLQSQLDGNIETYFLDPVPTLDNYPANTWTTNEIKAAHIGDLYYNADGYAYRFQYEKIENEDGSSTERYYWNQITDTDIILALMNAKKAQDTADSKRKVFIQQPSTNDNYDVGDLWSNATYMDPTTGQLQYDNDLLRAVASKAEGESFSIKHWELASKYTDDTAAIEAKMLATEALAAANKAQSTADSASNLLEIWSQDGYITPSERQGIKEELQRCISDNKNIEKQWEQFSLNQNPTQEDTDIYNQYDAAYFIYGNDLLTIIGSTEVSIPIPTDFDTHQTEYYENREVILYRIAEAAKAISDEASAKADLAKKDAEAAIESINKAQTSIDTLGDTVTGIQNFTDDAFKDNVISESERSTIIGYSQQINTVWEDVAKSYESIKDNALLKAAQDKVLKDLEHAYGALESTKNGLLIQIDSISPGNIKQFTLADFLSEYNNFKGAYSSYQQYLNQAIRRIEDIINSKADNLGGELSKFSNAFTEQTTSVGGLLLTSVLSLGYTNDTDDRVTTAGLSGLGQTSSDIVIWAGGDAIDATINTNAENAAKFLVRADGTGYAAGGNFWWNAAGEIHADPLSFVVGEDSVSALLKSFHVTYRLDEDWNILVDTITPKAPFLDVRFSGITSFDTNAKLVFGTPDQHGVMQGAYLAYDEKSNSVYFARTDGNPANLMITGGVTMYGLGDTKPATIMDAIKANLDPNTLEIDSSGRLTVIGGTGTGGVDEDAVRTLIESYGYATEDWVKDYVSENTTGGIESITKQMVIDALGFTPYSAENPNGYITAASIPSALKNPYALTFGSKSYDGSSAKEITASDLGAALSSDLSKYLPLSGGTVSNATTTPLTVNSTNTEANLQVSVGGSGKALFGYKTGVGTWMRDSKAYNLVIGDDGVLKYGHNNTLNTVWHAGNDGSGSGLDADLLDGKHISEISKYIFTNGTAYALAADSDLDTVGCGYYTSNDNIVYPHAPVTNFGLLTVNLNGGYKGQIVFPYGSNYEHIRFRSQVYENGVIWKGWRKLAYIDDNVASATYATSAGNADTLDGVHASKLYQVNSAVDLGGTKANYDTLIVRYSNTSATSNHPYSIVGGNQCVALNLYAGTDYAAQLAVGFGFNYLAYRRKINSTSWQSWVKINAGLADEATKLQTARTIWGQSFDGTADVTGNFYMGNNININGADTSGNYHSLVHLNNNNVLYFGYGTTTAGYRTIIEGNDIYFRYKGHTVGMVMSDLGNVGIGTTSPSAKLHVVGGTFLQSANEYCLSISRTTTGGAWIDFLPNNANVRTWRIGAGTSKDFVISSYNGTTSTNRACITLKGNVGVGIDNPSAKLHVVGNILATGGVTMQSQRSLKNVVDERGLSLTELSAIKPTRYTWKDKRDDRIHFGGIADDIEKVLPEVIYKTSDGTLTMDYGNAGFAIASSLIKPVVDHETKIIDHDTEIRMLKIRVKELEEELKRYSA